MTLLSLASRQIWPQLLGFLQLNPAPEQLILFHSTEEAESKRPAERLRALLEATGGMAIGSVELCQVRHDSFQVVVDAFAATAERLELDETNCTVNLTGGNKLMAMAAAEWCRLAGVRCFYLERDLRLIPFLPKGADMLPQPDYKLDTHLARNFEPLALLRCQIDAAEIINPGQRLTLGQKGKENKGDFQTLVRDNYDFQRLLEWDVPDTEHRVGDALEYAVAACLLKLGVPVVQRGVRLAPRVLRRSGREEAKLDLVFNWAGKLWLVDCKDRLGASDRVNRLRTEILSQTAITSRLGDLLNQIAEELRERDLKPLKEDMLLVGEAAGLLGRAVCVRRSPLPIQAQEFAHSRMLPVVLKENLFSGLRALLFPDQPASLDELRALAVARTRASA